MSRSIMAAGLMNKRIRCFGLDFYHCHLLYVFGLVIVKIMAVVINIIKIIIKA